MKTIYKYFKTVIASLVIASLVQVGLGNFEKVWASEMEYWVTDQESLEFAIADAYNDPNPDVKTTIYLMNNINLDSEVSIRDKKIIIKSDNSGMDKFQINSAEGSRHFVVESTIYSSQDTLLELQNVRLVGGYNSGGVNVKMATLTVGFNSEIIGCIWNDNGGGVKAEGGTVNVNGGIIAGNIASAGGGIYLDAGLVNIMNYGNIASNQAGEGGGIFVGSGSTIEIFEGKINNNIAEQNGGGIFINGANGTWSTVSFRNSDTSVEYNEAKNGDGGGIYGRYVGIDMYYGKLFNNHADNGNGGGIFASDYSKVRMYGVETSYNTANNGGGVYFPLEEERAELVELHGGQVTNNTANEDGGAIFAFPKSVSFVGDFGGVTFSGNSAGSLVIPDDTKFDEYYKGFLNYTSENGQLFNNYDIYYANEPIVPPVVDPIKPVPPVVDPVKPVPPVPPVVDPVPPVVDPVPPVVDPVPPVVPPVPPVVPPITPVVTPVTPVVPPVTPVVPPVTPVTPTEPTEPVTPVAPMETPSVMVSGVSPLVTASFAVNQNGVNFRVTQNPDNPQEYFIFDEDGTPLGSIIVPEGKTIEDMDIEAELTPLGVTVNKKENPKTGDFNYLLFMGTTVLSLVVLVLMQKKFRGDMY